MLRYATSLTPLASFIGLSLLLAGARPALAQEDLTNAGATITVQAGATLYVGTGGLRNANGATLTNAGTLRVDGPLLNPGTLSLGVGALEARGDLTNTGTIVPGTSTVTFNGPADQLLTAGGATLHRVEVNKTTGANTLRLAGDLTVSNLLTLTSGLMSTKAPGSTGTVHTLRLPNGAALSGEATGRYVLGALEITRDAVNGIAVVDFGHGAALNPVGNSLGTVVITRRAGLTTPNVSFGQNLSDATLKGIDRIWTVAPVTQPAAGQPVQLTLSWLSDNDNGLNDFSVATMWQQPAADRRWEPVGPAAANGSSRSLTMSPRLLNRFTVSNAPNPLPVTLTEFTAQAEGPAAVRLRWATATERNNAGFTVERSLDGRGFVGIGTVAGAGSSATPQAYALLDGRLPAGARLLYYRLRQTDLDGTSTYSPVRPVALTPQAAGFVVFPTSVPTGRPATYLYTGPAGPATLRLTDMLGRAVRQVAVDGRAQGEVPLTGLAAGAYLLRYTTATGSFGARLVVE